MNYFPVWILLSHKGMHEWMHRCKTHIYIYSPPPIHLELEPTVPVWVGPDTNSGSTVGGFPGLWAGLGHFTLSTGTTRWEYSTILQWTQKSSKSGYTQCSHKKLECRDLQKCIKPKTGLKRAIGVIGAHHVQFTTLCSQRWQKASVNVIWKIDQVYPLQ